MKTKLILLAAFIGTSLFVACGDDDGPKFCATYEGDIKAIVDNSCAYSGCHSGADASMFVTDISKDYTSYAGMQATLSNGSFAVRTLDSLDMPPFYTPDGHPKELTQEEKDILACWIAEGFPEK